MVKTDDKIQERFSHITEVDGICSVSVIIQYFFKEKAVVDLQWTTFSEKNVHFDSI